MRKRVDGCFLAFALLSASGFACAAGSPSPLTMNFTAGNTSVRCQWLVATLRPPSSGYANSQATVDCYVPSGRPGAGTVVTVTPTEYTMRLYRDNIAFNTDYTALLSRQTARPQLSYFASAKPSSCVIGRAYLWHAEFDSSFKLTLAYNGAVVNVPKQTVIGAKISRTATSTNCNWL
jgi:hypothetical protein